MASGRTMAFPAPSLRELLSAAKLRECRPMVPPGQWFTHRFLLALKFFTGYVHRSTLPQSRIRSTAPSGREPGVGLHHSTGYSLKSGVTGDFHRPYETQKFLHFTIHRGTLPQSRIRSTAPSEREPGMGWCHSTGYSLKSQVTGDFHRPYGIILELF